MDMTQLYPEYLNDLAVLVLPKRTLCRHTRCVMGTKAIIPLLSGKRLLRTAIYRMQETASWSLAKYMSIPISTSAGRLILRRSTRNWHRSVLKTELMEEPDGLMHRLEEDSTLAHKDWELAEPWTTTDATTTHIPVSGEGIERFLITDINNPGASAQAQSTVARHVGMPFPEMTQGTSITFPADAMYCTWTDMSPSCASSPMVPKHNLGNSFPVNGGGLIIHEATHGHEHHEH